MSRIQRNNVMNIIFTKYFSNNILDVSKLHTTSFKLVITLLLLKRYVVCIMNVRSVYVIGTYS